MAKFQFTEMISDRHKIAYIPGGIRLGIIRSFSRIIVQWELENNGGSSLFYPPTLSSPEQYYLHRIGKPAVYEIEDKKIIRFRWYDHGELHCDIGPAVVDTENKSVFFFRQGKHITKDVIEWMQRDNIPLDYKNWTSNHKLRYKLKFS